MAQYILEAGGTMAFTFHVLFMLFNLFIIYQFYFNDKFFNELGFSNEEGIFPLKFYEYLHSKRLIITIGKDFISSLCYFAE